MIFQFTFKKIISLLACISITILCLVIPASAAVTPGQVIEGIGTIGTLWDIGIDAYEMWQELNPDKDPSEYPGFNPGGSFSGAGGSRDDAIARYEEYVSGLQTDLGTTALLPDGGIRLYFKFKDTSVALTNFYQCTYENTATSMIARGQVVNNSKNPYFNFRSGSNTDYTYMVNVYSPFAGEYVYGYSAVASGPATISFSGDNARHGVSKNENILAKDVKVTFTTFNASDWLTAEASEWVDIYPLTPLSELTQLDLTVNSRPSSIVGDYGIMGDDGSIVKVEGGSLVNESENLVYSPTTAGQISYTNCAFDYADRSYTLTLEDGSTMKVVYGDENVTIEEGDTIYNVYYLMSDSESGGSGSDGGGSGSGGEVGDAVSGLLGGLGNILAGLIEGLLKMAAQAVEALGGLIDIFNGLVDMILGFFSGFTGFLGSMFPFLPEETFVILNFGLILLIAAAVIKRLFL